jgi:hypothetical protein
MAEWKNLLLEGHRKFIYAGSDAHGNFNRYRQIRTPFVSLEERSTYTLGICRTGVLDAQPGDVAGLLAALKAGRCIISTGPFINLHLTAEGRTAAMGETIRGLPVDGTARARKVEVRLELASTAEFGPLTGFRLLRGRVGSGSEELLEEATFDGERYRAEWEGACELEPGTTYFRAEVESRSPVGTIAGLAMTNPIWVENS